VNKKHNGETDLFKKPVPGDRPKFPQCLHRGSCELVEDSPLQRLDDVIDPFLHHGIGSDESFNLLERMDHRGVMLSAKSAPDLGITVFSESFTQIHRDLPWYSELPSVAL